MMEVVGCLHLQTRSDVRKRFRQRQHTKCWTGAFFRQGFQNGNLKLRCQQREAMRGIGDLSPEPG